MFSAINAPVKDVLLLAKPFNLFFVLFGNEAGLSFWWYGRLLALLLVSFELCIIITKKNKIISLCGMLVIAMSAAVQWWYSTSIVDMLIFGQLALVMIDIFMRTSKLKAKIISAIGVFISIISYVFVFYPAWQVSFGYVFFAIFLWILVKNWKTYKINLKDTIIIGTVIIAVAGIGARYYILSKDTLHTIMNTSYPGERFEIGEKALTNAFSYTYTMFFAYSPIVNPCEYSGMLSIFPIPMIVAIVYLIRNKKGKMFLIPLLLVSLVYTIWITTGTNEIFAKISLLYMTEAKRIAIPLGLAQIYILMYLISNFDKDTKFLPEKYSGVIAFIAAIIIFKLTIQSAPMDYMGPMKSCISGIFLLAVIYSICNMQNKRSRNYLLGLLMCAAILTGAYVNPIIKGTDVIYKKPFSNKIQEIIADDNDSVWISDATSIVGGNYLLANGAKVINSTNIYPNEELYTKLLGNKREEYKEIWNRYAHIAVEIVEGDTSVELANLDVVKINININDLQRINVKYVASYRSDLERFNSETTELTKIYGEDGCYIYIVNYI